MSPQPIRWACNVVPGHEHGSHDDARRCILRHTVSAPYGWCPCDGCGKRGLSRRDGIDRCEGGHEYGSGLAIPGRG